MVPIKNIGNTLPLTDRLKQRDRVDSPRHEKTSRTGSEPKSTGEVTDRDTINISSEAKQLAENPSEVAQFQDILHGLRNEDTGRIAQIREKITNGDFNRPEVLESVSTAISGLAQFSGIAERTGPAILSEAAVNSVSERIRSGHYQSDVVLQEVATNILADIGAF